MRGLVRFFTTSIRNRILFALGLIVFVVIVTLTGAYLQLRVVAEQAQQVVPDSLQLVALQDFALATSSLDANLESFFIIGGAQFQADIEEDLDKMVESLAFVSQNNAGDDDAEDLTELEALVVELRQEVLALVASETDLSTRQMNAMIVSVYDKLERINELQQEMSEEELEQLQTTVLEQQRILAGAPFHFLLADLVVTIIAVAMLFLVNRGVTAPLSHLTQTVTQIAGGNLTARADVTSEDELGQLALAFNSMTEQLNDSITSLERRVAERTQGLVAAAEVSNATTLVLDIEELLPQIVELVQERFKLYYVGLFLTDAVGEYAVLRAGSGEAGRAMLDRNHRLRIGGDSMIGRCVVTGIADIQLDVGAAAVRFDNPDLPDTRSELALPLRSGGQIIGAMTVQSERESYFSEEDISVMQTMADQVANAVRNARLFQQVQESLEGERRAYGTLTQDAWRRFLQSKSDLGFMSDRKTTVQTVDVWRPEMDTALHTGRIIPGDGDAPTMAIPIKVRDQVVGVIDGRKPDGTEWTQDEVDLLVAMVGQLNVALEGAQLYEDTQRRAAREQLVGQITGRMRESLNMEVVLRTAVGEMRQALGLERLRVRLGTPDPSASESQQQSGD